MFEVRRWVSAESMMRRGFALLAAGFIAACGGGDGVDFIDQTEPLGSPPTPSIARYNGPGDGSDSASAVATDDAGNVYVAGKSRGAATEHAQDFATVAYDAQMSELWVARYNGEANRDDAAVALALDAAGNVYVAGHSDGEETGRDFLTVKYDASGVEQWARRHDTEGHGEDTPVALAVDAVGRIYVAGHSTGQRNGSLTIAYASDGTELWVEFLSFTEIAAIAPAPDAGGGLYITGTHMGSRLHDRCGDQDKASSPNYLTIRYGSDGETRWSAEFDGPCDKPGFFNVFDYPHEISDDAKVMVVDSHGNAYVSGTSGSRVRTVKYDPAGVELWTATYKGAADAFPNEPRGIAVDAAQDRLLLTVSTCCTDGVYPDIFFISTLAYDTDGELLWATRYDAGGFDEPSAIAVAPNGDVVVAGVSGTVDLDQGLSEQDYIVLAYDAEGQWLWMARHDGPEAIPQFTLSEYANLVIGIDGHAIVAGASGDERSDFVTISHAIR
jgi:hypothetical protein